jgi:hypothetical protein
MAFHKKHSHKRHPGSHRRNASDGDDIPDDILLTPAPFLLPQGAPLLRARTPSKARRAARAVRRTFAPMAPKPATITTEHLIGVGANAAGGIATALAANELVDNIGVMPMAIGATVVGGFGSAFLSGHWQRIAQGVLGAGVGQLGTAYLTERALKKAATAHKGTVPLASATQKPPAAGAAGKRNAYQPTYENDDLVSAMERTERRLGALLSNEDARNAYSDSGIDADETYGWAV